MQYDIVVCLSYYAPYVSGVTEVARLVAEALAERGQRVVVVTSRHDSSLPPREVIRGVVVERVPVLARIGKGVVTPSLAVTASRLLRRGGVGHLHLPMIDAAAVARFAGRSVPMVSTYHCDVELGGGTFDRAVVKILDASNRDAIRRSRVVVVTSHDYADNSRLRHVLDAHRTVIPPPCLERGPGRPMYRETSGLHVGFLGRIVAEKGIEYLVRAFRAWPDPDARLLIGGDYQRVAGGSVIDAVQREIGDDNRIRLLGFVPDEAIADFYASLDVFVLPSVNALEAFGITQVEAMLAGIPVIAADRPGVRVPVQTTGFGVLTEPGNPSSITAALARVPTGATADDARRRARRLFGLDAVVDAHAALFAKLRADRS